jgi:putative transposase
MSEHPARKLPRLEGYDYAQNGAYFVTICTHNREMLFGEIVDDNMQPNNAGEIVLTCWNDLAKHYTQADYDAFVIMPNHVHAIVVLVGDGRVSDPSLREAFRPTLMSPPSLTKPHGLPQIIGSFKSFSARRINEKRDTPGVSVWQSSYHDRIIRDEADLNIRRQYILNNPSRWQEDVEYSSLK